MFLLWQELCKQLTPDLASILSPRSHVHLMKNVSLRFDANYDDMTGARQNENTDTRHDYIELGNLNSSQDDTLHDSHRTWCSWFGPDGRTASIVYAVYIEWPWRMEHRKGMSSGIQCHILVSRCRYSAVFPQSSFYTGNIFQDLSFLTCILCVRSWFWLHHDIARWRCEAAILLNNVCWCRLVFSV